MQERSDGVSIVRCKSTTQGLLVLFSDDQVYLFHNSFLVSSRLQHADRISRPNAIQNLIATRGLPDIPGV